MNASLMPLAVGLSCLLPWVCLPDLTTFIWLGLDVWLLLS